MRIGSVSLLLYQQKVHILRVSDKPLIYFIMAHYCRKGCTYWRVWWKLKC